MVRSATLPSLLWEILKALDRAYTQERSGGSSVASLDLWANLLRVLNETGTDVRELPQLLRLSKRAVKSRLATAARHRWVEQQRLGSGGITVRLTSGGSDVKTRWKAIQRSAEKNWQSCAGVEQAARLRASLENIVRQLPLEHPHYPASYGAADASITGGNGQDWKAVPRLSGSDVSNLPLSSLVSQALVAFAIEYEKKSPVALSLSTVVIKRIPSTGLAIQELGNSVGVAALVRHGFLRVDKNRNPHTVFLTSKGLAVSESYDVRILAVEAEWCSSVGHENVRRLREVLEDLANTASRCAPQP